MVFGNPIPGTARWRNWSIKTEKSKKIKVNSDVDGNILFARLFGLADDYKNGNLDAIEKIEIIIDEHTEKR